MQLMHGPSLLNWPDDYDVFLASRDPTSNSALSGFAKCRRQQSIRLGAALIRRQIIGSIIVKWIHRLERDKLADVDGRGGALLQRLYLCRAEHHVLVFGEFVPFHHLRALDQFTVVDCNVLLLDA